MNKTAFYALLGIAVVWQMPAGEIRAEMRNVWENNPCRCGMVRPSANGHAFEYADGTPFFWLGDTAWALHQNLSREDVEQYLDDAAAAGFNVIQLMSVNAWALDHWKNFYGATPYLDDSAAKLNPPFWEHLGSVIDQAAARGLFVLLVYGSPERTDNHGAMTRTPAEAYAYGNALGTLYRDKANLIWSGGIDVNPDDAKQVSPMGIAGWHAMAECVADGIRVSTRLSLETQRDGT